jgi:hypothetical protein
MISKYPLVIALDEEIPGPEIDETWEYVSSYETKGPVYGTSYAEVAASAIRAAV